MGKQIKLEVSVYYSDNSRRIHLLFGDFRATVSGSPERVNYHPELVRKLGQVLREAGKPAPQTHLDDRDQRS
ncbi:hypothetical protein SAMN02983003_1343 [Devosia enhydra]|uniref:Uncharacterized protein n=1 Tax=Devosia enhydra TaxID=665118 RepID=A0A1K2HXB7_9HYPH|nr:hypothetical protein [Devosia enhydra]SFZ82907.1 hypothetical protein SAMN02983003_1343 [Devosia enhydra]